MEKITEILIPADRIQKRVKELAEQISADFSGKEVVMICNLKGAFRFLSDLCANIRIPVLIDFISFTSYNGAKSSGDIRIVKDLNIDISDRQVILVEDIVDTGVTLKFILRYLGKMRGARDIKVCTLLDKKSKREIDVYLDYIGFDVPDKFLVGYGLDYNEHYRELNYIGVLEVE